MVPPRQLKPRFTLDKVLLKLFQFDYFNLLYTDDKHEEMNVQERRSDLVLPEFDIGDSKVALLVQATGIHTEPCTLINIANIPTRRPGQ